MKRILSLYFAILAINSAHSQDLNDEIFINTFFAKQNKVFFRDKVGKFEIEDMEEAFAEDTIYALRGRMDEPNDRLVLSQEEHKYVQNELKLQHEIIWNKHLLKNGIMLTKTNLDSISIGRNAEIYTFSKPIYLRNSSICIFYSGYVCGRLCGEGKIMLFKRKNGIWVHWMDIRSWMS